MGRASPCIARSNGIPKSAKVTMVLAGFPGSPRTDACALRPKAMGLPGLMATRQKSSVTPAFSRAGRTTS